jgi:FkbM family methyltransferase
MPVIGLMTAIDSQPNLKRWCIDQLPLYDAVVCVDTWSRISNQIVEQYGNRLIRVRKSDRDDRDRFENVYGTARDEIVRRFGPSQWIMLCHTNEYCYHDPAKIAVLADGYGSDVVGWYSASIYPSKELRGGPLGYLNPDFDGLAQYDWCYANTGLPPIEYRLYRDRPGLVGDGLTPRRHLSDLTRKAPFHPILRCYHVVDPGFSFGERDVGNCKHDVFDEPWNLGEEFRTTGPPLCRVESSSHSVVSDEFQMAQRMPRRDGASDPPSSGELETHVLQLADNTKVDVPLIIRGVVDRSIVDEIWNRDAYGLRAMADMSPATVIDIGAHIGIFSLFATMIWPNARIVACEADPENFQLLSRNTFGRTRIELIEGAATDADDTEITFHAVTDKFALNSGGGSCARPEFGTQPIRVPAIAINKLWRDRKIEYCDLLKLDCEGSELPLLSSLMQAGLLNRVGVIVGEWHANDNRIESIVSVHRELRAILGRTHKVNFAESGVRREGQFVAVPIIESAFTA